jgi:hypothetical protein
MSSPPGGNHVGPNGEIVITPWRSNSRSLATTAAAQPQLQYLGGPVERQTSTNFTVFWQPAGATISASYQSLVNRYFSDVGGSSFYGLLTQYGDTGGSIVNSSGLGGTWVDTTPYPSNPLTDSDIQLAALRGINTNNWPVDITGVNPNNIVVYTASGEEVCAAPGVCSSNVFCGYHSHLAASNGVNTVDIKYASIPYGGNHIAQCGTPTAPNGDAAADGAINISSHEHFETVTDPEPGLAPAWMDSNQQEIGDKCLGMFGSINGQGASLALNGHPYVLQQEWSNLAGQCSYTLAGPPVCTPRPPVQLSVTPSSTPGVLNVSVTSTGTNVFLQSVTFGAAVNARITAPPFPTQPVTTYQFTITRVVSGVEVFVPFTVTDSCGGWQTFAGGGPTAF